MPRAGADGEGVAPVTVIGHRPDRRERGQAVLGEDLEGGSAARQGDVVDVDQSDLQTIEDVCSLFGPVQLETGSAGDNFHAKVDEIAKHL